MAKGVSPGGIFVEGCEGNVHAGINEIERHGYTGAEIFIPSHTRHEARHSTQKS
jgi:hypothetical protein